MLTFPSANTPHLKGHGTDVNQVLLKHLTLLGIPDHTMPQPKQILDTEIQSRRIGWWLYG